MTDRDWFPLFVAVTAVQVYQGFLPALDKLRREPPNATLVRDVRLGQAVATGTMLTLGMAASLGMDSTGPFVASVLASIALAGVYEWALRDGYGGS